MNLIDTNGVSYILTHGLKCQNDYYLSPDVVEEAEMTQVVVGKKLPEQLKPITDFYLYDEAIYIDSYKRMLNSHGGRSFFNMTGFGDISILAVTDSLIRIFATERDQTLFDPTELISIFTNDRKLKTKILREFSVQQVEVRPVSEIS